MKRNVLILTSLFILAGCGGTQRVVVSPSAEKYYAKTVLFVAHGGNSSDMDHHIQRELLAKNLSVTASEKESQVTSSDMIVKYSDNWSWDIAMYLSRLDITFLDKSGNILATGSYENSFWHEWPDAGDKVKSIIDEIYSKMPSPLVLKKQ